MLAKQFICLFLALLAEALPRLPFRQLQTQDTDCGNVSTVQLTVLTYPSLATDVSAESSDVPGAVVGLPDGPYTIGVPLGTALTPTSHRPKVSPITFVDPDLGLHTETSTDLPVLQAPSTTFATQDFANVSGSVVPTLETAGNPPLQPFPTSIPTITEATLQPFNTEQPIFDTTIPDNQGTQTLTIPVATYETIVGTQTVTSVPVETMVTITSITVLNTTSISDGSTFTSSYIGTAVIVTTATALSETTVEASSTVTQTIATTITTDASLTTISIPSATETCSLRLGCTGQDLFKPVGLGKVSDSIEEHSGHPAPRLGITNATGPIETNKFYANFFLGSQGSPSFVLPYSLTWSKGSGNAQSYGMSISHIDDNQKVFGPPNVNIPNQPLSYYINPLGIQSITMSASELRTTTELTSSALLPFSVNIHLSPSSDSSSIITFPIVQGMGFVTGLYRDLQPVIQTSIFFRSVVAVPLSSTSIYKYRITLEDGKVWLLYALPDFGINPNFELQSSTLMQGIPHWSGQIQVAKVPPGVDEAIYDNAAGVYPTTGSVAGYAQDSEAEYSLSWSKGGPYSSNTSLLMFALPHHVQSFDDTTRDKVLNLTLQTPTKGLASAVLGDYWLLREQQLPIDIDFAPWRPAGMQAIRNLSAEVIAAIQNIAAVEASQNISAQSNLNSMYYSGKALSKFATIIWTMHELLEQEGLAQAALSELISAFSVFTNNQQQFPLYYDTDWKGLVSSASYITGDPGVDFGNSYYNDHHFHYGYFIHAAAIVGHLDPTWLAQNKDYINGLVRDVSNPSSLDQYFPVFRSFDWYHGHSWAKGLYESGDGKDEESSSEDALFAYALKMWGKTVGDTSMELRGSLMLSVLARSLDNYFLLKSTNVNQPAAFIGNKVTGILFENKVDHTTYFGLDPQYVQGIHMIPLLPFSTLTRSQQFVAEEWVTYFADGAVAPASNVQGGWKGILYANLAIINPTAAYNFFSQSDFDPSWIDGGASRTWYMTWSAMLGGGS